MIVVSLGTACPLMLVSRAATRIVMLTGAHKRKTSKQTAFR